jgi:predicted small lipoprotein YifL
MTLRPLMIAALLGATALAGCGKTGPLIQPAPLFGAQAKADYEAKQKADAQAKAAKQAEPQPVPTDPTAQPLDQAPYAQPVQGPSDPFRHGPQGALPNPGAATDR